MYNSPRKEKCPCTRKEECERHSNCDACQANHRERGYPTACQRVEGEVYLHEANVNDFGLIYGKWMGKDDTWTIATRGVNAYLLVGSEKALLIDTCHGEGDLRRFVEQITDKPVIVANTHGHYDHTGGNPWWKEAYMSKEAAGHAKRAFSPEMQARHDSLPYPDYDINIIDEGHVFDLGNRKVEVIRISAHSPGSLAYLDSASRYLFTGDELEAGQVLLFLNDENVIQKHKNNMEKLLAMSDRFDAICPSHNGSPLNKKYISDFLELDRQILEGTQTIMPNLAGYGFPKQSQRSGPFGGDIKRAQYGGASVLYK